MFCYYWLTQMCEKEERDHLDYLGLVWDTYVPFIRHYGDDFQAAMQAVPVVSVPKVCFKNLSIIYFPQSESEN